MLFLLMAFPVQAEETSAPKIANIQETLQFALQGMWGKAIDSKGNKIYPANEQERITIPIPEADAVYILKDGLGSGLAKWCDVDWQERYRLIMQYARKKFRTDIQIAYVSMLHGMAQGIAFSDKKKKGTCAPDQKRSVQAHIDQDNAAYRRALSK